MNEVQREMTQIQRITWHYVMDIHEPEEFWYSSYMIYLGETF